MSLLGAEPKNRTADFSRILAVGDKSLFKRIESEAYTYTSMGFRFFMM